MDNVVSKRRKGRDLKRGKKAMRLLLAGVVASMLLCPGVAFATVEEDQSPLSEAEIEAAIAEGAVDTAAEDPIPAATFSSRARSAGTAFLTYAGATMFETAVAEARAAYPGGCESAIIVGPGDAWVDALSVA
ncbi:hypothetical protein, partial [Adlercreutzia sp. ZJ242]|uniref:hypothetical protein n=1 Tax=Adlercreutzia sp. ZJ242 TaxID=2709409 RepID=UPI0013EADE2F